MSLRIYLARFLIKLGRFVQELAVTVMRPKDLIEFSRQSYSKAHEVKAWGDKKWIESGLTPEEINLLEELPIIKGKLCILGVGGGREAIYFAKKGITVTGVDFISEMAQEARKNLELYGVKAEILVQEISKLKIQDNDYDFAWISMGLYSAVPTKKSRVNMLKNIGKALKPGGHIICLFHWNPKIGSSFKTELAKKISAFLTLGNFWYEKGDMLWGNFEFLHAFNSEDMLRTEFEEGGFEIKTIHFNENTRRAGAIIKKSL
jgi:SAM-dependent methyltransferase